MRDVHRRRAWPVNAQLYHDTTPPGRSRVTSCGCKSRRSASNSATASTSPACNTEIRTIKQLTDFVRLAVLDLRALRRTSSSRVGPMTSNHFTRTGRRQKEP